MKYIIPILTILIYSLAQAQPGGGGGVQIMVLLDVDGNPVKNDNPMLQIKQYKLSNNLKRTIKEIPNQTKTPNDWGSRVADLSKTFHFIQPFEHNDVKKERLKNQRLQLIFKQDTMTVDFINILPRSADGSTDKIDTLHFVKGKFIYYRIPKESQPEIWKTLNEKQQQEVQQKMRTINRENIRELDTLGFVKIINMPLPIAKDPLPLAKYPILYRNRYSKPLSYFSIEKFDTMSITTSVEPLFINGTEEYDFKYFYLNYHNECHDYPGIDLEPHQAMLFLGCFTKQKLLLYINKKVFSGTLKLAFESLVCKDFSENRYGKEVKQTTVYQFTYIKGVQTSMKVSIFEDEKEQ